MEVEIVDLLEESDDDDIRSLETTILETKKETEELLDSTLEATPEELNGEDNYSENALAVSPMHASHGIDSAPAEGAAEATSGCEPSPLESWEVSFGAQDFQYNDGVVKTKRMHADGECMYRAVLHQRFYTKSRQNLLPSDEEVGELRRGVAAFMRENEAMLEDFFAADRGLDDTIRSVEEGEWGDSMTLYVISNIWCVRVEVYVELGPLIEYVPVDRDAVAPRPLRLAYRCVEDDEGHLIYNHYDSVLEVVLDIPPSVSSSAASPPRRSASTQVQRSPQCSPRRSPARRSPRRSPRTSPCKVKKARVDPDPPADEGPSGSQELVDPASPTPGLLAPGSPNTGEASASQEASQEASWEDYEAETSRAGQEVSQPESDAFQDALQEESADDFQDALQDSLEERLAAVLSPIPRVGLSPVTSCPSPVPSCPSPVPSCPSPVPSCLSSVSSCPSMAPSPNPGEGERFLRKVAIELPHQPLTSRERASQWLQNDIFGPEDEVEDDFHLYLPDVAKDHTHRKDIGTQFSTIYGSIVECSCTEHTEPTPVPVQLFPSTDLCSSTRTVSTNAVLSNGKLVGTFQAIKYQ